MSALHGMAPWRDMSLEVRVAEWRCRVCGLHPERTDQIQSAHLMAVAELRRQGGAPAVARWGWDREMLVALCKASHAAYDYLLVGARDPRRLRPQQRGKLWRRIQRHLPGFMALLLRRARLRRKVERATARTEASRLRLDGAIEPAELGIAASEPAP
jgi:hypothetical protein